MQTALLQWEWASHSHTRAAHPSACPHFCLSCQSAEEGQRHAALAQVPSSSFSQEPFQFLGPARVTSHDIAECWGQRSCPESSMFPAEERGPEGEK